MVPGSTLRYGSSFCIVTRSPRATSTGAEAGRRQALPERGGDAPGDEDVLGLVRVSHGPPAYRAARRQRVTAPSVHGAAPRGYRRAPLDATPRVHPPPRDRAGRRQGSRSWTSNSPRCGTSSPHTTPFDDLDCPPRFRALDGAACPCGATASASASAPYYRRGTTLVDRGALTNAYLYILRSGAVDIIDAHGAPGRPRRPGRPSFGMSSVMTGALEPPTRCAHEDSLCLLMPADVFRPPDGRTQPAFASSSWTQQAGRIRSAVEARARVPRRGLGDPADAGARHRAQEGADHDRAHGVHPRGGAVMTEMRVSALLVTEDDAAGRHRHRPRPALQGRRRHRSTPAAPSAPCRRS